VGVEFCIKTVQVLSAPGKYVTVTLPEVYKGTKEAIRANISKILEKAGYQFSPET
jgi:hypothetical protein